MDNISHKQEVMRGPALVRRTAVWPVQSGALVQKRDMRPKVAPAVGLFKSGSGAGRLDCSCTSIKGFRRLRINGRESRSNPALRLRDVRFGRGGLTSAEPCSVLPTHHPSRRGWLYYPWPALTTGSVSALNEERRPPCRLGRCHLGGRLLGVVRAGWTPAVQPATRRPALRNRAARRPVSVSGHWYYVFLCTVRSHSGGGR